MAVAGKTRLSRKTIKQPDEFITFTNQALLWAREHQQLVTWVGAGVVAIMVALGVAVAYRGARDRDANADLARAMTKLDAKDYAGATSALTDVASRWEGTGVAPLAALLAANAAIDGGDADKAITQLASLQAQSATLPGYLQQQVLIAWGAALENKQQWLDAAEKYKAAGAVSGPYTVDAILGEARTRELGGQGDRARELYKQVFEQFPDLPDRQVYAAKAQL
jgi:predicted negative regulator of RcsB-dependent stress response